MIEPCAQRADPRQNGLLASLPDAEWRRWQHLLQPVTLSHGQVLSETGSAPAYVTFPTTAVVSLLYMTRDGESAEFAVVGNDGVVGVSLFMGGRSTPSQAVVQVAGLGFRLPAKLVMDEVHRAGPVLEVLLRYTQTLISQVVQTAACNRFHTIDQQFCRRLLLGLDRTSSDQLEMTQEGVAGLLGVRREGVTAAALKLQRAGVIRYRRGRIEVLDRAGLEERSCECYAVTRKGPSRVTPVPLSKRLPLSLPVLTSLSLPLPLPLPLALAA